MTRPLTVHMRRYLAALYAGTSLRKFATRYDSVRKSLVTRGLIERYRLGGPTSTRYAYMLTEAGIRAVESMPTCPLCEETRTAPLAFGAASPPPCARCAGTGIDVEEVAHAS